LKGWINEFHRNLINQSGLSPNKTSFQQPPKNMKLELDIQSPQNSSAKYDSANANGFDNTSEDVKKLLRAGIKFAKEGSRTEARQMLLQVTEADSNNETAWLWLASISEYPEELLVFLQNVLRINPENERAIEWAKQTKALLSKTFVQRGIDASRQNQKDFAKQCFLQAIVHDDQNEMAWLWLASSSDAPEEKCSHLQKVLNINPENETALTSLKAVKNQISHSLLKKANSAAISGDHEFARQMLADVLKHTPNLEEAWMLKAFLTNDYYDKMACYQKALEINPNHDAALAGVAALQALAPKPAPSQTTPVQDLTETKTEVQNEAVQSAEADEILVEVPVAQTPVEEAEEVLETVETDEFQPEATAQFEENQPLQDFYSQPETARDEPESNEESPVAAQENQFEESQFAKETLTEPQTEVEVAENSAEVESISTELKENRELETETVEPVENFNDETPQSVKDESFDETQSSESDQNQFEAVQENSSFETQQTESESTEELNQPQELQSSEELQTVEESDQFSPETTQVEENQTFEESLSKAEEIFARFEESEAEDQSVEESSVPEQPVQFQAETPAEAPVEEHPRVEENNAEVVSVGSDEEVAETAYQDAENGFMMLASNQPFADYQLPTVELSYPHLPAHDSPEVTAKTADYTEEIKVAAESSESVSVQPVESELFNSIPETAEVSDEPSQAEVSDEPLEAEVSTQVFSLPQLQVELLQCAFCGYNNQPQTVICDRCQAMLSLSDLEMLLAHQNANQDVVLRAIEQMEVERTLRDLNAVELQNLGVAHLNVHNLRKGFSYLQEASGLNPNDVVLASKVNFLAIRLNEIEEHDQKVQEKPVQSRTILVVDDSPTVRKLISGKLEKSGHSVVSAVDGMDALAKINEVIPDLILLDITMPRLDGYQVCKLIRNNEATKDLPIVMISGKDGFFDKVRGRMAGSTGYITKPFGPDTLMKTIETYLA